MHTSGILFSLERAGNPAIYSNIGKPGRHYAK
jgi:hypothetical protein